MTSRKAGDQMSEFPLLASLPTSSTALGALARAGLAPLRPVPVFVQGHSSTKFGPGGRPAVHLDLRCAEVRDADEIATERFTLSQMAEVVADPTGRFEQCSCSSFDRTVQRWTCAHRALATVLLMLEDLTVRADHQLGLPAAMVRWYRMVAWSLTHPRVAATTAAHVTPDVVEAVAALAEVLAPLGVRRPGLAGTPAEAVSAGWHRFVIDVPDRHFHGHWLPDWQLDPTVEALDESVLLGAMTQGRPRGTTLAVLAAPATMRHLPNAVDFGRAQQGDDVGTLERMSETLNQLTQTIATQQPKVSAMQAHRAALASLTAVH